MRTRALALLVAASLIALGACSSDSNSSSGGEGADGSFCSLLIAFRTSNDALSDDITSGDTARSSAAIKRMVGQVELLQQKAPTDIKPDVDVAAGFINQFDALMARYDYDIAKVENDAAATDEFGALNSDEVTASLDQLRAYGDNECGASGSSTP